MPAQDLLFFILAISVLLVSGFLCWALYEIAHLVHQVNEGVTETRHRIEKVEMALTSIKERIESSVTYLGIFAQGWKSILGYFQDKKEKKRSKHVEEE